MLLIYSVMAYQGAPLHSLSRDSLYRAAQSHGGNTHSGLQHRALTQICDEEGFSSSHSLFRTKAHLALRYVPPFH